MELALLMMDDVDELALCPEPKGLGDPPICAEVAGIIQTRTMQVR